MPPGLPFPRSCSAFKGTVALKRRVRPKRSDGISWNGVMRFAFSASSKICVM